MRCTGLQTLKVCFEQNKSINTQSLVAFTLWYVFSLVAERECLPARNGLGFEGQHARSLALFWVLNSELECHTDNGGSWPGYFEERPIMHKSVCDDKPARDGFQTENPKVCGNFLQPLTAWLFLA